MKYTTPLTEEWIQQAVLADHKQEDRVPPTEIGVTVRDGIVTLSGLVDSYAKRADAEEAAHRGHGVRAVADKIETALPLGHERSDPELAMAISKALEWDALVPTEKLDVTVSEGWVTLKGEVEHRYQRLDAERIAARLAGVKGVTNLSRCRPS